ncbi:MAG TPA: PAS domain S-box protein [Pyrinomonadaceae bacterium]|nr:PAS domain S-box protein [Pyrinomonadaceae bacterium]
MISPLTNRIQSSDVLSDETLRALVDACISNVAVLSESGKILYASKAWHLFQRGRTRSAQHFDVTPYYFENCKRVAQSDFEDEAQISLAEDLQQILSGEEREFHHKYHCQTVNQDQPFVMHAARLNLPGSSFRVLITHEDVPLVREEVKHTQARLTQLLETTKVMAWEGEIEPHRFTYVSGQAVKMLGYPTSMWYEPNFLAAHIHPDDRQRVLNVYQKQTTAADHFDLTFRMLDSNGRVVWVQNLVSVTSENRAHGKMHGFMIDISERKRAEEALKYLGSRLIAAQEEERKRVARELHDDLSQRMAVLSIEMEQLGQRIEKPFTLRKHFQRLQLQAQEIASDIHRLSYKLHPSKLDHLGLAAAVKSLCEGQNGKARIHFHQSGFPADLPKDATLCIFRIAQEVLRNCAKHSGADSVQVLLTKTDHAIRLSIADNGCGFDTKSEVMEKGLGFLSMRERLRLVGGEISIYSQPRRGTRIEVSVPLSPDLSNYKAEGRVYATPPNYSRR